MNYKQRQPTIKFIAIFITSCISLVILFGALILPSSASSAQPPANPKTIIISPAGVVTWEEMLQAEAAAPISAVKKPVVIPRPPAPAPRAIEGESNFPSPLPPIQSSPLGTLETVAGATLSGSFAALEDNNTRIPPDTMGAVGPTHLMTMLNSEVRIQDKSGNNIGTVSLSTFWTNGTGLTGAPFDPRLIYDPLSGRWMATIDLDARSANSSIGFAISAADDPTGSWIFYEIDVDEANTTWADFPDIGANSKWVAITNNMFRVSNNSFRGAKMWVIDKATALTGGDLIITEFSPGFDNNLGFSLRVAVTYDATEPALYLLDNFAATNNGFGEPLMRVSHITGTAAAPIWEAVGGSTFGFGTGLFALENPFEFLQINAAQSGTTTRVNTNDPRLQNAVFRNGRLWTTHSGGLPFDGNQLTPNSNRTAVFWYELDPNVMPHPIVQSGVIDGGQGVHHFFPSLAVNANNEMVIGFSRSDSSKFVEAVVTGRQANDPAGAVDPIQIIKAGEDSYVKHLGSGRVRWGDYSAASVDPTDDLTFWTIQEYAETDVGPNEFDDRWGTWWGRLVFQVDLAITNTTTVLEVDPGDLVTYTITVANNGPAGATGVVVSDTLPTTLDFISADASQGAYNHSSGAWNVGDLNDGNIAALVLTVKPNHSAAGQTVDNTAIISHSDQPDLDSGNNDDTATITVTTAPNLTISKTVTISGSPPVRLGDPLTYTIIVANNGGSDATNVSLTDALPTTVNGLDLDTTTTVTAGGSVTFVIPATLSLDALPDTVITNTAYYSHTSGNGQASAAFTTESAIKVYLPVVIKY